MSHKAPPVLPISDLRTQAKGILGMVKTQPVIITQRGRANAVLLSYELYTEMIARLEHLEDFRDAALLRRAQDTSQGVVPASALSKQYSQLHQEPFDADLQPAPIPSKVSAFAAAKETKGEYRTSRRGKRQEKPHARSRSRV